MMHQPHDAPRPRDVLAALRDVHKFFGAFHALKGINLDVHTGEKIVLCGPSGSGKSTLIRTINQLERVDAGQIVFEGVELGADRRTTERVRRNIGMVFQHFNLFPHMTVLQNCMLAPMRVRRLTKAEATARAIEYLDRVHVGDQAGKFPAQLSGGQQQRVAIARALCMEPHLMLFDEPTSALDPEMVNEVLDTMVGLAHDGMTMIVVTHEMGFARSVADRIIFMCEGELVEEAQPAAFFESPRHARTRQFLRGLLHPEAAPR